MDILPNYFEQAFPYVDGRAILEVNCGVGLLLMALSDKGFKPYGVEANQDSLERAKHNNPSISEHIRQGSLPNNLPSFSTKFDGIILSEVIDSLPRDAIFEVICQLKELLNEGGAVLVSTASETLPSDDSEHENLTPSTISPIYIKLVFERLGFECDLEEILENPEGTNSTMVQVFRLVSSGLQALDRIEGVLNRDTKFSSYKFALLRAVANIAAKSSHRVVYRMNGFVAIPIDLIVEEWIVYYWPMFETNTFIPQMFGEKVDSAKPVSFRKALNELIQLYLNSGGLTSFLIQYKSDPAIARSHSVKAVFQQIRKAIKTGPVQYAGNSSHGLMFRNSKDGYIEINNELWREFTLMSHWLIDALIVRWGNFCAQADSSKETTAAKVIELLLTNPLSTTRCTNEARSVYSGKKQLQCVWTETKLRGDAYEVDHLIPFSLWQNNELWNLVPASKTANNRKRDKLPTLARMIDSKDRIIDSWKLLAGEYQQRFLNEAARFTNQTLPRDNWELTLFNAVKEAVEVTAIQRSWPRY